MSLLLNDIYYLVPEFFFIVLISIIIVLAIILKMGSTPRELIISLTDISIVGLVFTALLYISKYSNEAYIINSLFKDSLFLNFLKIVIIAISIIIFIASKYFYSTRNTNTFELPIILLFSIFGILTTISSNDLVLLYLALEMQSLSIYALVSSRTTSNISVEAGLKYFILGSFISGFILYSISLIYLFTGTTNIKAIELLLHNADVLNSNIIILAIVLLVCGLLFKLSAAPLHNWTPDVFDGAPTIITLFIATVPKIGIFYILTNILFYTFYNFNNTWSTILLASGILSIIIGSFGGIYQTKLKRLLAYSTINNMGFVLLGLGVNHTESVEIGLFYITIYIILSISLFVTLILFCKHKNGHEIVYIDQLSEVYKKSPVIGIILGLNLFSLIGIPPLAGFLTKFYLLLTLVNNSLFLITLFALAMSVITSFYYIRLVNILFFSKEVWYRTFHILQENLIFIIYTIAVINLTLLFNIEYILKVLHVLTLTIFNL